MADDITIERLLVENKEDLEVGSEIMMEAQELMMDPETFDMGAQMMRGAKEVWIAKGRKLVRLGRKMDSQKLTQAGQAHIKSAEDMSAAAFRKAGREGRPLPPPRPQQTRK